VLVADLVGQRYRRQVVNATDRAKGTKRLVLRTAVERVDLDALRLHLDLALAAHGAGVAGAAVDEDRVAHRLAADRLGPLEGAFLEVARGQDAPGAQAQEARRGAAVLHGIGHVVLVEVARDLAHAFLVGHVHAQGAAHGDGLEVLGAHDRAHTGPAVGVLHLVEDAGVAHHLLARRPDHRDARPWLAQVRPDCFLGITGDLAPSHRGVAQLGLAVLDPQVDRLGRLALEDDGVKARLLELRRPPATGLGLGEATGQRRLAGHGETGGARRRGAVDDAAGEDEQVVGPQRVHALVHLLEQVVGRHRPATQVAPVEISARRLYFDLALGKINAQDLAVVTVRHWSSSPKRLLIDFSVSTRAGEPSNAHLP
jgi:hypothetical protein